MEGPRVVVAELEGEKLFEKRDLVTLTFVPLEWNRGFRELNYTKICWFVNFGQIVRQPHMQEMFVVETGEMYSVETDQMSAVETGQDAPPPALPLPPPPWTDQVGLSLSMHELSLSMPESELEHGDLAYACLRIRRLRWMSPFELKGKTDIPKFQHVDFAKIDDGGGAIWNGG